MKIIRDLLIIIAFLTISILGILMLTNYIIQLKPSKDFIPTLGAVSTTIACVGGLTLLIVTFLYLIETRKIAIETTRQRVLLEEPAVSLRVVPDNKDPNFLFFVLKNTGGSAAYDISVKFNPDLSYRDKTLNALNMFQSMPLLDKGDESKFFFDSAVQYFKNDNPKETTATITYYTTPMINQKAKPIVRDVKINFEEKKDTLHLSRRDINDLVNELEELKHTLLIAISEKRDDTYDREHIQRTSISNNSRRSFANYRRQNKRFR